MEVEEAEHVGLPVKGSKRTTRGEEQGWGIVAGSSRAFAPSCALQLPTRTTGGSARRAAHAALPAPAQGPIRATRVRESSAEGGGEGCRAFEPDCAAHLREPRRAERVVCRVDRRRLESPAGAVSAQIFALGEVEEDLVGAAGLNHVNQLVV